MVDEVRVYFICRGLRGGRVSERGEIDTCLELLVRVGELLELLLVVGHYRIQVCWWSWVGELRMYCCSGGLML